jgi:Deoxyribonuclease NucA/NucB
VRRLLALILAAIAAFLVAPQAAVTATSVTSVSVYTYDGHHHSAPSVGGASERGPPAAGNHFANDNAVDRRSYGDSARPDIGESPAAYTYTYTDPAPSVQVTPTTWHRAEVADGQLIAFARGRVAAKNAPTVTFSRSRAPGIAQNFDNAVANGAPTSLTRVGDATRKANRRAALRGQSRAPAGQSLDEYPFACSAQGGCGSFVRSVPVGEQNYQGGVLSRFFQDYGVNPGDPFNVLFGP